MTASATAPAPFPAVSAALIVALAIALPWLDPFAGGPSAAVQPLLFSWFCCGVLAWFAAPARRSRIALPLLLLALGVALLGGGVLLRRSWSPALRDWLPVAAAALAIAVCAGIGRQPRLRRAIVLALLAAALLNAAIGLLQYFGLAGDFHPWLNVAPAGEAFGNLRQRNQLASLLNIGLVALLWFVSATAERPAGPDAQPAREACADPTGPSSTAAPAPAPATQLSSASVLRLLAAPAAVLLALGNAATASRTGFVQLLLVAALAGWWRWRASRSGANRSDDGSRWSGGWQVLLPAGLAYALGALLLPTLAGLDPDLYGPFARLAHGAAPCASRLVLWGNVLELIALRPWSGWGLNELDYAHFIHLYGGPRFCDILDNAHNLPLQLAVELGVPVALLACAALLWLVLRARPWREIDATRQFAWSVLAVIGVHSLLEYPLWYGPFQIACGLALGLLLTPPGADISMEKPVPSHTLSSFIATIIVAMCFYAAYDYGRVSQIYEPPAQRTPDLRANPIAALAGTPTLFADQIRFARLTTTPVTAANAAPMHALAAEMLHFSPEPRVAQRLIDSARLLGREDEARFYEARLAAAFPAAAAGASAPAVGGRLSAAASAGSAR